LKRGLGKKKKNYLILKKWVEKKRRKVLLCAGGEKGEELGGKRKKNCIFKKIKSRTQNDGAFGKRGARYTEKKGHAPIGLVMKNPSKGKKNKMLWGGGQRIEGKRESANSAKNRK